MISKELQQVVTLEAICLALIVLIILASYKRWKVLLGLASAAATIAFYIAWSSIMATASILIYAPASILMWLELDDKATLKAERHIRLTRTTCWTLLVSGVTMLILVNIYNIYKYLN